ncbi:hypothetical protein [Streptomyces aureus]|uniref:hypothetical protein n=1 Tax=Streptomyces aureus TaxID=193461 RepID=UPI0006E2B5EB|nr:hypothetical protein [Streptomyces aureus]
MNSEEPRQGQGWPAPPGHPPAGPANGGHDGYGGGYGGGYGAPAPIVVTRTSSHRGAWIGAAATLVAAMIGVVGTYLVATNNDGDAPPPQAQTPVTSSTGPSGAEGGSGEDSSVDSSQSPEPTTSGETSTSEESSAPPTSAAPPAKPGGTEEWKGALVITYTDDKDLDSAPPVESEIRAENDFSVYPFGGHMLQPGDDVKALVWKDSTNKTPSYADCARDIDTLGTSTETELRTGMVVCAATNDGRLARLTVKELAGLASDTRAVFDVVVWSR